MFCDPPDSCAEYQYTSLSKETADQCELTSIVYYVLHNYSPEGLSQVNVFGTLVSLSLFIDL